MSDNIINLETETIGGPKIPKRPKIKHGAFQIYTGEGKGKSTASLGLMLRALGSGMHVYYVRMLKPRWKTGELKLCPEGFHPNLTFRNFPHYWALCVSKTIPEDVETMKEKMKPEMDHFHEQVRSGKYDLIIADEINYCIHRELISLEKALAIVDDRPKNLELVFTGRYAKEELIGRADLVTEMCKIKHHFDQGIRARIGIEF
ncbi:MAG: cob(I)yrinic acid a,c-diamide adenosyltransferase [Dehalococcoidia bacterium]|nr:cob(I)yrinic acid a,c-diamide adenosyltransferase [Dehalococcoidia bacterium]